MFERVSLHASANPLTISHRSILRHCFNMLLAYWRNTLKCSWRHMLASSHDLILRGLNEHSAITNQLFVQAHMARTPHHLVVMRLIYHSLLTWRSGDTHVTKKTVCSKWIMYCFSEVYSTSVTESHTGQRWESCMHKLFAKTVSKTKISLYSSFYVMYPNIGIQNKVEI